MLPLESPVRGGKNISKIGSATSYTCHFGRGQVLNYLFGNPPNTTPRVYKLQNQILMKIDELGTVIRCYINELKHDFTHLGV